MSPTREILYQVHLWTGLIAGLLLVPICLTGSYLVWHVPIDSALNPERGIAPEAAISLEPEEYLESARQAYPDASPASLIMPAPRGVPVMIVSIFPERAERHAMQPRVFMWLDPVTGRVLDSNDSRDTFIAWAHRFHFYLDADPGWGRQLVGLIGILLFVSCLTAIWLWWPKPRNLWRSVSWQPRLKTSRNLHFVFGIWIMIPMLILAVTGIYLSYPDASARLTESFAPMQGGVALEEPVPVADDSALRLSVAEVIATAQRHAGSTGRLTSLEFPEEGNTDWRVTLATGEEAPVRVVVDDNSGTATAAPPPTAELPGDNFAGVMHALHDGQRYGVLYQAIIVLAGLLPLLFLITGTMLWLRRRELDRRAARHRAERTAASQTT